ncbi:MAG: P1 family peptidase [Candidatus Heimdallarchaeota archaeon]
MQNNVMKKPRARDLGIPFEGSPGPLNAITDVQGVEVGHTTLISGEGKLIVGKGPIRTGVTAIFPRGKKATECVFAGWFSLNGNGEMTGTTWVEESGFLEGPIMLTNTHSVGIVRDSVIEWHVKQGPMSQLWSLPVVAETYDGFLNDINGFHIKKKHVFKAIENASSGSVLEGSVGSGTGMICFEFKGGIGTASRKVQTTLGEFILGVLVQANFGRRDHLQIAGVPVGLEIQNHLIRSKVKNSIIIVIATDTPLLPHQLTRLAHRASLGLGKVGSISSNFSGDIFLAFSTANRGAANPSGIAQLTMFPNEQMDSVFEATIQATEEAIVNALCAAETMIGRDGNKVISLPHNRLREVLNKYGRLIT